jgi:hypothetical protein
MLRGKYKLIMLRNKYIIVEDGGRNRRVEKKA